MEFEGKVWKDKDSSFWVIEVPFLDIMTEGKTRKEALCMLEDAVEVFVFDLYKNCNRRTFSVSAILYSEGAIGLSASDDRTLLALGLRRQRELSGTTVREASKRLKSSSPNAYGRYERARVGIFSGSAQIDILLDSAHS